MINRFYCKSYLGLLLVSVLCVGCSTSRYTLEHDIAPTGDFDASKVPDEIPRWEPVSPRGNQSPYYVNGKKYHIESSANGYVEEGVSSWYGMKFHGEQTSNGEIYNMYAMSAAHKSLPLPTYLRVTNLANQKAIVVRVNDRGPFHEGRIIDLSFAAAKKLGFAEQGTARVKLEALTPSPSANKSPNQLAYFVQVAALSVAKKADAMADRIRNLKFGYDVFVSKSSANISRVRVGPFDTEAQAQSLLRKLKQRSIGSPLVIRRSLAAKGS